MPSPLSAAAIEIVALVLCCSSALEEPEADPEGCPNPHWQEAEDGSCRSGDGLSLEVSEASRGSVAACCGEPHAAALLMLQSHAGCIDGAETVRISPPANTQREGHRPIEGFGAAAAETPQQSEGFGRNELINKQPKP